MQPGDLHADPRHAAPDSFPPGPVSTATSLLDPLASQSRHGPGRSLPVPSIRKIHQIFCICLLPRPVFPFTLSLLLRRTFETSTDLPPTDKNSPRSRNQTPNGTV